METTEPRSTESNEHPAPPAVEEARVVKKRRGFWRRTGMVIVWLLFIVLVLESGTGLLVQLPFFRRFVVNELAGAIENGTNGKLTVGDIQGNLFEGFVMNDVTLRLKTGTAYDSIPLVHVDRMIAKYSLFHWIRTREIEVSSLLLQHPVIRFVKFAGDTTWNYSLFTKATPSKVPSTPFTQILDFANLQIQDGSFSMRDYNSPAYQMNPAATVKDTIDWSDVRVQGIDLETRFNMHGASSQSVHVSHLQFREKNSGLFVQRLGFSGYLDSTQARIDNAKIVTGHSDLGFSIQISPPSIIGTGLLTSLQHSSVKASVNGPVISTYELKQFLRRPLGFLAGSPGIDLVTTGEFGKLHIQKLALDFKERGGITISGDLNNLHHPDSLTMNLVLRAKDLSNATLDDYVPGLHLPDLSRFGTINISNLTFNGPPLNFRTVFDAKSSGAGDAAGDVQLDARRKEIVYRASIKTNNFNVAALARDPDFESSITAEAHIAGRGTNWRTMESTVTAKTDGASSWGKYRVTSLDLAGAIKSGTITTDHLDATSPDGPEIHVRSAMAELASPSIPFHFDGRVTNLPLAQVLANASENPARVDLDANITGTAKNFETVMGTAHLRLFDLACQGHPLPEDTATITIGRDSAGGNELTLQSSVADLTIDRHFQIGDLIHVIPDHISALVTAIKNRDFPRQAEIPTFVKASADSIDFDYRLQIKDLRSLADFFPQTFLLGQGVISGAVSGAANDGLNVTANGDSVSFILRDRPSSDSDLTTATDSIKDSVVAHQDTLVAHRRDTTTLALPKFGAGIPRIQLMPTTFRLSLRDLSNDSLSALAHLDAKLDFTADSVLRLGSALFYHPHIDLVYQNEVLNFDARSIYNNALGINLKGDAHFPNGDLDFALDTLKLTYKNPYFTPTSASLPEFVWMNEGQARIQLAKNGILTVDSLSIIHPLSVLENPGDASTQHVSIGGILNGDSVNAWANFPSFKLEDLKKILPFNPNAKTFDFTKYHGKVRDTRLTLNGTLEQPDISAKLFVDAMTYVGDEEDTISFDSNYVDVNYRDQELRGIMDLHVAHVMENEPGKFNPNSLKGSELRATIDSIPMLIAFKRGPDYAADSARVATQPLSASIHAEQFPLDVATPFLPPFRQIVGTGDINFSVTGTRENIEYAGQASIKNGELLLAATNMWYLFGGQLAFAHDSLVLQNDTIHNISSDDSLGSAILRGSFTFKGFDITNFDLRLRSNRLMVLSNAAKESLPAVYGPLTINTGGEDFDFYNTFDAPVIAGTINILSANITMPPSNNSAQSVSGQGIIYETLPRDSTPVASRIDTVNIIAKRIAADQVASVKMSAVDDTLFPNRMKDIYRDDNGTVKDSNSSEADVETPQANVLSPSFTDKLRMHLTINTQGTVALTIPFGNGAFGDLFGSQIKADLLSGGTVTIERGDDLKTQANGSFELSPNSTFTFLQTFNIAKGTVSFTRDFGNPNIDITATYIGTHATNSPLQAKIVLDITGTKNHPILTAENSQQNVQGGEFELKPEPSSEIAVQDAVYFLYTGGYFMSDATNNAGGHVAQNFGTQAAGNVVSNIFGNITGTSNFPLSIRGASFQTGSNAGGQISGAYRDIFTFKVGGSVGYGTNTIIDIPASSIPFLSGAIFHNMLIELQGNTNPSITTPGSLTQQPIWLSKLIYNIPIQ